MKIDQSATDYLKSALAENEYLKIGVKSGGCNGFAYSFELVKAPIDVSYRIIDKVVIDGRSIIFLNNTTLIYSSSLTNSGLSIINPEAKSVCGCGESFST